MQTDTDRIRARLQAQRQQEGTAKPLKPVPTAVPASRASEVEDHALRCIAALTARVQAQADERAARLEREAREAAVKSGPRKPPIDPNNPPIGVVTIQSPNGKDLYEVTIHRKPKSQVELFASRAAESMARGDRAKAAYWSQQCARLLGRR